MIFEFLFGKKKSKKITNPQEQQETKDLTLEEKIEKEMVALPAFIQKQFDKDPTIKERLIAIAKRMRSEGVDLNSPRAMKKWIKEHEKELKQEYSAEKVQTVVKDKEPGRNDPCPCGSGKKYKKCCGANK